MNNREVFEQLSQAEINRLAMREINRRKRNAVNSVMRRIVHAEQNRESERSIKLMRRAQNW